MIVAAIVGLWVILRPKAQPAVANNVNPESSGLPNYVPAAQNYQVGIPQLAASPAPIILADPYNPSPGQPPRTVPPAYLAFNLGPGHDLSKVPLTQQQKDQMAGDRKTACGCGDDLTGCAADVNHGVYPDGRGGVMAKSGPELLTRLNRQDPSWINRAAYNLLGSDVNPAELAQRHPALSALVAAQPGTSTPAQPAAELPPSVPGQSVLTKPVVPQSTVATQLNSNAVVNIVGSVDKRATQIGSNLFRFGHQVPTLSAAELQRLVQMPMAG